MQEKIKPVLNNTTKTMLQSFYARAEYSQRKKHKFYDAKAVELVNKIDYDFSTASKDRTMSRRLSILGDDINSSFAPARHPFSIE